MAMVTIDGAKLKDMDSKRIVVHGKRENLGCGRLNVPAPYPRPAWPTTGWVRPEWYGLEEKNKNTHP